MKQWIKRKGCLFLAAILLLFVGGGGADKAPSAVLPAEEPLTIWLASDLHYLSPKLTDNGIRFQNRMLASDGKLTEHSAEIVERFLQLAAEQKPDALILSGDLTYDGEKQSLRELAKLLKKVQDAGVSVLVIPGNHDIAYPFARKYSGESSELVDNIPQEDFIKLCGAFGYRSALSADEVAGLAAQKFIDGRMSAVSRKFIPGSVNRVYGETAPGAKTLEAVFVTESGKETAKQLPFV